MKVSLTLSAASNAKERNIVALKRYQETIDEEELSSSFASKLRRRMGSARPIGVSRLEEDLELSTTVNDSETSSAANQPMKGVTEKPTSNGDQSTTECALESSTGVGSSKRKPPSSSCVPQKRSKVSPLTPRSTEILLMSHSEAGPSNVSSQPPHFMDCITSTPHDPTENHKIAGGYLRLLQEVDKLFQSRFQKDAEGRLYRENHRISQYQEGYGMLVTRFCEGSRLELKLMDEKVAALKRLIKRFNEELVMTVNAKRDLLDSHAMFSRHVSKVLADMPSKYNIFELFQLLLQSCIFFVSESGLSDSEDESVCKYLIYICFLTVNSNHVNIS